MELYRSFKYEDNTTIRPSIIDNMEEELDFLHRKYDMYPNGYQIIKASLKGWDIEGVDADGAYSETLKRLNNGEFGWYVPQKMEKARKWLEPLSD